MQLDIEEDGSLIEVVNVLIERIKEERIVCLTGDLGAGKTTLVKEVLRAMGSSDDVSSPSFSIINEYHYPKGKAFHMDMYRLKSLAEAQDIGIEEYFDSGQICFIEWPELIMPVLPDHFIHINISVKEDGSRSFKIS